MPGIIVDGQDVTAVYEVTRTAVELARSGGGPTLIEAKTYRFDEHQVGLNTNNDRAYRTQEEIQTYTDRRDPIALFRQALLESGVGEQELLAIEAEVTAAVERAIKFAEASALPNAADLYEHMYSNPIVNPMDGRCSQL